MADDAHHPEGFADRARERGADMFAPIAAGDERPDLSDANAVEGVVRGFLQRQTDFRRAYLNDPSKGKGIAAFIEAEARAMAKAFTGQDPAYETGSWHTSQAISDALKPFVGEGSAEDQVDALFTSLASDYTNLMAISEAGQISDEGSQYRLNGMIAYTVHALLGLPLDAD